MGAFSQYALVPEQGAVPDMAQLDGAMQERIREMAVRLNVHDGAQVAGFGARAQKEMGAFSDIALAQMLRKDTGDLSGTMKTLSEQITACSFTAQAKGFFRKMFGGSASLDEVRAQYDRAEPRINACADEMTDRRVALMRDSALLERLYERNENLYRELCSLIVVGDEAVRQAKARGEQAHIVSRLERRVEDIRVTQLASTQLAAQIRMIQANDSVTCEKLKAALEVTIPLWKSQMAAALGLARATDSLKTAQRVSKEAVRGMRQGAKELRAHTDAYAKAAGQSDRQRAEETARELLEELEDIEAGLKARELRAQA
ncbi:MAG: toxic anion resistance protein [Clostridia bacterium]|nr:toxic anion resistance protein [Clostridia bacterium]